MSAPYDVVIAGGGPAGLACALSFARDGWRVCVVERAPEAALAAPSFDGREIALTHHTRQWLMHYGVWQQIAPQAVCPLRVARIESGQEGSAPLLFRPSDADEGVHNIHADRGDERAEDAALGYLVANHLVRHALYHTAVQAEGIDFRCGRSVEDYHATREAVTVRLDGDETLEARLLVGADGRFSRLRDMAGIGAIMHDFGTNILVCRMRHPVPHHDTALQWFGERQTIALLPVASDGGEGALSSLVLTLPPEEIARLKAAPETVFNTEITRRTNERLGPLSVESPRVTYPLKAVYAHRFHARRLALIGDAAVGMHPITAHGFNFGIRGQESLVRAVNAGNGDPGDARALSRFAWVHRRDTAPLFAATNAIAVAYTRDEAPFLLARRAGLAVAERFAPLKKVVARVLMDPAG